MGLVELAGWMKRMDDASLAITFLVLLAATCHNTAVIIDPFQFDYVLQPNASCTDTSFDILIWVHASPNKPRNRIALRETWANNLHTQRNGNLMSKVIFFMGYTENDTELQSRLEYENEVYQDIVQESYRDNYHNLTYKAVSALKWITSNCDPTKYRLVLKTDDDVLVDHGRVAWLLRTYVKYPQSVDRPISMAFCHEYKWGKVNRNKNSKWYVPKEEYPHNRFPRYCAGMAVLFTNDLIEPMWRKAQNATFLWIDDVFLTGVLWENMSITKWGQNSLVGVRHYSPTQLTQVWTRQTFIHVSPFVHDEFYKHWWGRFGEPDGHTDGLHEN